MFLLVLFGGVIALNTTVLGHFCQQQVRSLTLVTNEFGESPSFCNKRDDEDVACETSKDNLTTLSKQFCLKFIKSLVINSSKSENFYQIEPPIFERMSSLKELSLEHVTIPQKSFEDLWLLNLLCIEQSNFEYLDETTFASQRFLIKLWISGSVIPYISNTIFQHLLLLEVLGLPGNGIKTIEANAFDNLKNLIFISLHDNQIHTIEQLFQNLPKLTFVNLSGNQLNLLWHEFVNVSSINFFDVSSNKIERFDEKKIAKAFPKLAYMKIDDNLADTKNMRQFAHNLGDILLRYKSFSVHFTDIRK